MKKLALILFATLLGGTALAQSKIRQVEGKWELAEDGKVAFRETYQFPDKTPEELFLATQRFITNSFGTRTSIDEADPGRGYLRKRDSFNPLLSKEPFFGKYKTISVPYDLIFEIDKDRVRVSLVLLSYEEKHSPVNTRFEETQSYDPALQYPVNENAFPKRYFLQIFYKTYRRTMDLMEVYRNYISLPSNAT